MISSSREKEETGAHYAPLALEESQSILSPRLRYSPWIGIGASSGFGISEILAQHEEQQRAQGPAGGALWRCPPASLGLVRRVGAGPTRDRARFARSATRSVSSSSTSRLCGARRDPTRASAPAGPARGAAARSRDRR